MRVETKEKIRKKGKEYNEWRVEDGKKLRRDQKKKKTQSDGA